MAGLTNGECFSFSSFFFFFFLRGSLDLGEVSPIETDSESGHGIFWIVTRSVSILPIRLFLVFRFHLISQTSSLINGSRHIKLPVELDMGSARM